MEDKLEQLTRMERATLGVWRVANTVGWFVVAIVVGGLIQVARDSALFRFSERGVHVTGVIAVGVNSVFCVATALAIGGIIGARVWRDHRGTGLVALVAVLGLNVIGNPGTLSIPSVACIPLGYAWSMRVARARRV